MCAKNSSGLFKNVIYKICLQIIYIDLIYMNKQDLALNKKNNKKQKQKTMVDESYNSDKQNLGKGINLFSLQLWVNRWENMTL